MSQMDGHWLRKNLLAMSSGAMSWYKLKNSYPLPDQRNWRFRAGRGNFVCMKADQRFICQVWLAPVEETIVPETEFVPEAVPVTV